MDVSVIIVSWNTCDILHDCLASVYAQSKDVRFEVIVIDNGSSDGSVEMVKREFAGATVIENPENRGFAPANNQGFRIARGRYLLLLNSDTVVLDGAIDKSVAFADAHPEAAVVGCRALNPDRTVQPTCFMFPSVLNMLLGSIYLNKLLPRSKFFGRAQMTWWDKNDVREVDVVAGCFMLIRREVIEHVGVLDEQFFMYGEETDLCYRVKRAGWKVLFTPGAQIIHLHGASSKRMKPEMMSQLHASILLFLKKHKGWPAYILGCLLVGLFFLLRTPYWLGHAILSRSTRDRDMLTTKAYAKTAFKALLGWRALCFRR
ncbi:MAG: glycosyltransferase family 2 protein [Phycisphaerales bacterium]|nr:MAG: glycosyltransferase family 2 protein [Phycisphaerales bacterium]